jgi:hypothetical protein
MSKKDLKAFVRFDGSGRVVAGSLILRKNMPKVGKWQQITAEECCGPYTPPTIALPVVGTETDTTIPITWVAGVVSYNQPAITHYVVYLDNVQTAIIAAVDTLAYTFTGLTASTSYDISVSAHDGTSEVIGGIVAQFTTA